MSILLRLVGVLMIVGNVLMGIFTYGDMELFDSAFLGMQFHIFAGLIKSIIFFALAGIIDTQEEIKGYIKGVECILTRSKKKVEQKVCKRCGKEYDYDYTSCPYCGNRE